MNDYDNDDNKMTTTMTVTTMMMTTMTTAIIINMTMITTMKIGHIYEDDNDDDKRQVSNYSIYITEPHLEKFCKIKKATFKNVTHKICTLRHLATHDISQSRVTSIKAPLYQVSTTLQQSSCPIIPVHCHTTVGNYF